MHYGLSIMSDLARNALFDKLLVIVEKNETKRADVANISG